VIFFTYQIHWPYTGKVTFQNKGNHNQKQLWSYLRNAFPLKIFMFLNMYQVRSFQDPFLLSFFFHHLWKCGMRLRRSWSFDKVCQGLYRKLSLLLCIGLVGRKMKGVRLFRWFFVFLGLGILRGNWLCLGLLVATRSRIICCRILLL